jgi:DNA-binding response OmpR family regulator
MKKILVIDESSLFRDYLAKKLVEYQFEVVQGVNGLDGTLKMRSEVPDLIIMDYYLSRKSSNEVLQEKKKNPNTAGIPVIMVSSRIDKTKIVEIASYNVKKFFSKPLKMDALIKSISELLDVRLEIDETPCVIEAHFNDEILFIEIAMGLNKEKIELLDYKITELLELYQVKTPKVLIMMSNIEFKEKDAPKLKILLDTLLARKEISAKLVRILTNAPYISTFISSSQDYKGIAVADSLEKAMDDLIGLKPDAFAHDGVAQQKFLSATAPKKDKAESITMRFDAETVKDNAPAPVREASIAVVDDDMVIRELVKTVFSESGWDLKTYNNGKDFVVDLDKQTFDLVFLDLMMPEMNGFQVLSYLKQQGKELPIIVFSALSQKETVVKAMSFGIRSYLIKPLKPVMLLQKAQELLNTNF